LTLFFLSLYVAAQVLQLLAAELRDDSLYPELRIRFKLSHQCHDVYVSIVMPRFYPAAAALIATVRCDSMPCAAVEVNQSLS
jgi:hypothetical protein